MQLPDYQGGSLVNLMASLQNGLGGSTHHCDTLAGLDAAQVAAHRHVLLWIIDGLGYNYLRAHPGAAQLNRSLRGSVSSVYPPTTTSAITTLLTGDAPQQHGLTGWHMYFRELDTILAVLPGRSRDGVFGRGAATVDMAALLGHVPFADRIGVAAGTVVPAAIARSGFNLAHLGRARLYGYEGLDGLLDSIATALCRDGCRFVHAYWPGLDGIGHMQGIHSAAAHHHLLELERTFTHLCERLRGTDTLIIVCADHGQIDTSPDSRLDLDDHPALRALLVRPLCGEPRSVYCYLQAGCAREFDHYAASALHGVARALPAALLLEQHWFGPGAAHPELARRIGDRVLLMQSNYTLKDWLPQEQRVTLVGAHGGLSMDELQVPLIVTVA